MLFPFSLLSPHSNWFLDFLLFCLVWFFIIVALSNEQIWSAESFINTLCIWYMLSVTNALILFKETWTGLRLYIFYQVSQASFQFLTRSLLLKHVGVNIRLQRAAEGELQWDKKKSSYNISQIPGSQLPHQLPQFPFFRAHIHGLVWLQSECECCFGHL